jgi:hypothetical protein
MIALRDEYFGSAEQQALLRRGRAMFDVVGHDPRFTYYGRTVGLATPADGSADMLAALARLQGNSNCAILPDTELPRWRAEAEARGLVPVHYARWSGGADAMRAAAGVVDAGALPADLTLVRIGPDTDGEALALLAELALASGVLPPAGAALRGLQRPGLALLAIDAAGRPVACAAAAAYLHPDHPSSHQCWWGMLATTPARRGQRLALRLGAMAMLDACERVGFVEVFTGVEPGNAASEAVCARLGLLPEKRSVLGVADPGVVPGGRMTK